MHQPNNNPQPTGWGLLLGISEYLAVVERDLQFGIFAVEIILESVKVARTLPFAHGQVVEQIVAAALWFCGRHFCLLENPLEARDGETAHDLDGVSAGHDDIHTCETTHRPHIDDIVFRLAIAEPGGHQVFDAMHGSRGNGRFLVRFGDTQVEGGETLILARDIDAWLEVSMVDGETLYNFHFF